MKVSFWGTRGSIAKAGPNTVRFGGNTSCVEVRSSKGTLIIIDCGTGAHGLGHSLMGSASGGSQVNGHILISHTHWDHIQGIPFFAPLFVPGNTWNIYAPRGLGASLQDALAGQMQYTYFPVALRDLGATIHYHDLVEGVFEIDDVQIRTHYLNHPALTLGYRLEADGVSVVYTCDHEPFSRDYALGTGDMVEQDHRHLNFISQSDLAIHDAQYTANEYANKVGWGHTPIDCAVRMCCDAKVRKLALTHHDPMRSDDELDALVADARLQLSEIGSGMEVFAAAEGSTIELIPEPDRKPVVERRRFSAKAEITPALVDHNVLVAAGNPQNTKVIVQAAEPDEIGTIIVREEDDPVKLFRENEPSIVVIDDFAGFDAALDLCRRLRKIEEDRREKTPIVLISENEERQEAIEAGVTDWLVPLFTREYARTRLRAWVMRSACRWERARIPKEEGQRLLTLEKLRILDTEREERFDRITRLAATTFDVPIALVSLVDHDRQWFKSCVGLEASETPRDQAFCAHAILQDDALVVRDALLDDRFADNPLVVSKPGIRFYAGHPLSAPDGSHLGTLCVLDTRPRDLNDAHLTALKDLASLVEDQLIR